jgi:hypothetical protein
MVWLPKSSPISRLPGGRAARNWGMVKMGMAHSIARPSPVR